MSVNYLVEINALNDWELCHPLSATAYKVLCKLYCLANKERFPERITVPNRVLMSMVGCSEDSLIKARNQLIQYGRIEYKGQKKMTPLYMIQYFSANNTANNSEFQSYERCIKQGYQHGIEQGIEQGIERGIKQGTYINKTKQRETKENDDIYAAAAESEELNELAKAIARHNHKGGNVAYIEGVRKNLIRGGSKSIQAAKAELEAVGGCQEHGVSESDFGDDFWFDPLREFAG